MGEEHKTRRQMLEEFLARNGNDVFARYGLALECANAGDHGTAVAHFQQLLAAHPEYVPAYFHFGQLLARLERTDEAKQVLSAGIAAAQTAGDTHARDEMEAALRELD